MTENNGDHNINKQASSEGLGATPPSTGVTMYGANTGNKATLYNLGAETTLTYTVEHRDKEAEIPNEGKRFDFNAIKEEAQEFKTSHLESQEHEQSQDYEHE